MWTPVDEIHVLWVLSMLSTICHISSSSRRGVLHSCPICWPFFMIRLFLINRIYTSLWGNLRWFDKRIQCIIIEEWLALPSQVLIIFNKGYKMYNMSFFEYIIHGYYILHHFCFSLFPLQLLPQPPSLSNSSSSLIIIITYRYTYNECHLEAL